MNRTQQLPETPRRALTPRQHPWEPPGADTELSLPGWAQLPAPRRHRLVALLCELVRRNRASEESGHDGEAARKDVLVSSAWSPRWDWATSG